MKKIIGEEHTIKQEKIGFKDVFTTTSVFILATLLIIENNYKSIQYSNINITWMYSFLFFLRSAISSSKSFLYDNKKSPTRSTFSVVVFVWILTLFFLFLFVREYTTGLSSY